MNIFDVPLLKKIEKPIRETSLPEKLPPRLQGFETGRVGFPLADIRALFRDAGWAGCDPGDEGDTAICLPE